MHTVRALAPGMRRAGPGSNVLVGSQSMYAPQMPQAGYAASKGALLSALYYLADELGPDGIGVNMVVPSWMWGPPVQGYVRLKAGATGMSEEEVIGEITSQIPLRRIVPDEEVAEVCLLLASDRSRGITGQSILVNGGEMLR